MPKKKTHQENLARVCCVWTKREQISKCYPDKNLVEKVRHFQPSYDWHGGDHPTAICDSCRKACTEIEKDPEQTRHRVPRLLNYSDI